jgi:hypothetical protein
MVCKMARGEEEKTRILKMSAMSKYPFITLNQEKIDFESLLVGRQESETITVKNSSLVKTSITVEKCADDGKCSAFALNFHQGVLGPNEEQKITVTYTPTIAGNISCNYYKIVTDGGNECTFQARGEAQGFDVALSTNSVHFGEVAVDNSTNRLINVQNNNDLPCTFQFVTDKHNMFSFSQTEGVVKPHSFARIIVTFIPPKTGNFYERIFCMVRNHLVLYVDLMGTCFDILTKPIPLMQRHIDANRHKVVMGAHKKPKELGSAEYAWDKTNTLNSGSNTQFFSGEGADLEMPMDDPS